jgi:type VI secretion system secreted protein VgrG
MTNSASIQVATGDALDVRHFRVEQQISTLFAISVRAVSRNLDIDFDEIIGQPATFQLRSEWASPAWGGVCRSIRQMRVDKDGLATYDLTVVPRAWLMCERRNYRIFQMMSELDIVLQIFAEWSVPVATRVDPGAYKKRKYKVQYGESDFTFVSRLLEDAGIAYYFQAGAEGSVLVLDDAPHASAQSKPLLPFHDEPGVLPHEYVTKVVVAQQVTPGRATIGDVDYRRPSGSQPRLSASAGLPQEAALEQFFHEPGMFLFDAASGGDTPTADDRGASRTDEGAGARLTQNRLLGTRSRGKVIEFESNAIDLAPGVVMSTSLHPHRLLSLGAGLLVTRSWIEGAHDETWLAKTHAAPVSTPFKPEIVTPRPRVPGVESATVVGPADEEIHTDEFGRVRVHFHWDRESQRDERSSCWLPVSQPWAGRSFGGVNLPRVGQEVFVEFLGGDPDRPVVMGRVYTALQGLHNKLPQHKTVSGFMSESSPRMVMGGSVGLGLEMLKKLGELVSGSGDSATPSPNGMTHLAKGNAWLNDDLAGQEKLFVQAEKDMSCVVKNNSNTNIGKNRGTTVLGNDWLHVEGTQTETIDQDKTVTVHKNHTETVDHNQTITVHQSQALTVDQNQTITVKADMTESITGKKTQSVGKGIQVTTDGAYTLKAKYGIVLDSDQQITLRVKGSTIVITEDKITVQSADQVHINPEKGAIQAQRDAEEEKKKKDEEAKQKAERQKKADAFKEMADKGAFGSGHPADSGLAKNWMAQNGIPFSEHRDFVRQATGR